MQLDVIHHILKFRFEAGTSRGTLHERESYFLKLYAPQQPERFGLGECGPLPGLSPDLPGDLPGAIQHAVRYTAAKEILTLHDVEKAIPAEYPALRFALETAVLDWQHGGNRMIYDNGFYHRAKPIPINGLVWMGDKSTMLRRIHEKMDEGYHCIKIKVGAIAHEDELELLKFIRSKFSAKEITIRLDANGAYSSENVFQKLDEFARFQIHSIEQPVMAGDWDLMAKVCSDSPVPVALDEELIGIWEIRHRSQLLDFLKPSFIILKPTLLGGCASCEQWINEATKRGIGWWITSALESNIGLNAIAQFTANYQVSIPQGLGTGQLFYNNIPSPLSIMQGALYYQESQPWDLSIFQ